MKVFFFPSKFQIDIGFSSAWCIWVKYSSVKKKKKKTKLDFWFFVFFFVCFQVNMVGFFVRYVLNLEEDRVQTEGTSQNVRLFIFVISHPKLGSLPVVDTYNQIFFVNFMEKNVGQTVQEICIPTSDTRITKQTDIQPKGKILPPSLPSPSYLLFLFLFLFFLLPLRDHIISQLA